MKKTSKEGLPSYADKQIQQGGQSIDMNFMASNYSYRRTRPCQKSMDSQEFGFASNLINSMEVAPADELFFKGQLLPLQMDHRLHLVQALSCEQGSRGGHSRFSNWCEDEDVNIEYNSCFMGNEGALACKEIKTLSIEDHGKQNSQASSCEQSSRGRLNFIGDEDIKSNSRSMEGLDCTSNSMVDPCPHLKQAPSCEQGLQRELSMISWCKDKEFHSCRMEGDMGLANKASHRLALEQAPLCEQESRLSIWCNDEEIKGPRLSNLCNDEEISFSSCRMEGDVDIDYKASLGNTMMDLRSSSFRSQNSGFWESGADKDTGDSSSSSRDSNGSSQDSYIPNNTKLEITPSFTPHPHTKSSFNIPWKSLFKKASKKQTSSSRPISRMGYSEDLSKYKECSATSLKEAKEAMVPWMLANEQRGRYNQEKQGKEKGISSSNDRSKSGFKSKSAPRDAVKEDTSTKKSTATSKSIMIKGKAGRDDENEEIKRKERSADVKERWQGYARRLKILYEMKKILMGQFGIDECGRRACEVESGNIYAARTVPMQRRFSHQSSLFESHKLIIQEQNQGNSHTYTGKKMLAMSSCPPSGRSSPNHSGVLAVIAPNASTLQVAHCSKTMNSANDSSTKTGGIRTHNTNKIVKAHGNALPSSNYTSASTMHELHSALQSAIAHCKESNRRLDCQA